MSIPRFHFLSLPPHLPDTCFRQLISGIDITMWLARLRAPIQPSLSYRVAIGYPFSGHRLEERS